MRQRLVILVLACAAAWSASAEAEGEHDAEIAKLRQTLSAEPDNLDARFSLAQRLAWSGDLASAEREAAAVVAAAPTYLDALLLLGRLAAWSRRFPEARGRVSKVLAIEPTNLEALTLATDIEFWAEKPAAAREKAAALVASHDTADARFRAARAADLAMQPLEARRFAKGALSLDPKHEGAGAILRTVKRVRFSAVTEVEVFPDADESLAVGQLIAATVFPAARFSGTVGYDYRRRFATENHRASVGVAHRASRKLTVRGFLRGGKTEVVPQFSGALGASLRIGRDHSVDLEYLGDKMPWPGQLHRIAASGGVGLPGGFEVGARYEAGILRYCDVTDPVQGVTVRGDMSRGIWRAGLRYAFGMELDRAPLPPFLGDRFGDDVCAADPDGELDISLRDTRAQIGGAQFGIESIGRYSIIGGYTIHYRLTGELVHLSFLSLTLSL